MLTGARVAGWRLVCAGLWCVTCEMNCQTLMEGGCRPEQRRARWGSVCSVTHLAFSRNAS